MSTDGLLVTESGNGRSIEIARGAILTVRLETVPGTGYDWILMDGDRATLRLIGEELDIARHSTPGSAAHKVFRFVAETSGPSTITLHYVRRWEKSTAPKKTFTVQVITK
jgi:predicted secreted protein